MEIVYRVIRGSAIRFVCGIVMLFLLVGCVIGGGDGEPIAGVEEGATAELDGEDDLLPSWTAGIFERTILHDELSREYILYIPESSLTKDEVPLVLNFHGFTGSAASQLEYADFRPLADEFGFILVYPQGTLLNGEDSHWNVGGWTVGSQTDDVGFIQLLVTELISEYNIDADRVYATGHSNGGYMSFLLACQLSDQIAAVASMAGSMTPETFAECRPTRPVPVMQFHGTSDRVVPYGGASWTEPVDDVIAYWVEFNELADEPVVEMVPADELTTADSEIERIRYGDEDEGVVVEHIRIVGGGHEWLGRHGDSGKINLDMEANEEIWAFFARYDLQGVIDE